MAKKTQFKYKQVTKPAPKKAPKSEFEQAIANLDQEVMQAFINELGSWIIKNSNKVTGKEATDEQTAMENLHAGGYMLKRGIMGDTIMVGITKNERLIESYSLSATTFAKKYLKDIEDEIAFQYEQENLSK